MKKLIEELTARVGKDLKIVKIVINGISSKVTTDRNNNELSSSFTAKDIDIYVEAFESKTK